MILIPKNRYPELISFLKNKGVEVDYDAETDRMIVTDHGEIVMRESGYLANENLRPLVLEFFSLNGG